MNGGRGMTSGKDVPDRWRTAIIDMEPGRIHLRARPVRDLIGTTGFPQMIWPTVASTSVTGPGAALLAPAPIAVKQGKSGCPPQVARGFWALSRSGGTRAHARSEDEGRDTGGHPARIPMDL